MLPNVFITSITRIYTSSTRGRYLSAVRRTVKCWNSHALMMLVASFGKMPRFFCCLWPFVSESSSAVPSPEPMLLSRPSPAVTNQQRNYHNVSNGHLSFLRLLLSSTGKLARCAKMYVCFSFFLFLWILVVK